MHAIVERHIINVYKVHTIVQTAWIGRILERSNIQSNLKTLSEFISQWMGDVDTLICDELASVSRDWLKTRQQVHMEYITVDDKKSTLNDQHRITASQSLTPLIQLRQLLLQTDESEILSRS